MTRRYGHEIYFMTIALRHTGAGGNTPFFMAYFVLGECGTMQDYVMNIYATVGAEWGVTSPPTRIAHAHGWRTLSAFNRIVPSPSIHSFAQDLLELFNFWNDVFVANPLNDANITIVNFFPSLT